MEKQEPEDGFEWVLLPSTAEQPRCDLAHPAPAGWLVDRETFQQGADQKDSSFLTGGWVWAHLDMPLQVKVTSYMPRVTAPVYNPYRKISLPDAKSEDSSRTTRRRRLLRVQARRAVQVLSPADKALEAIWDEADVPPEQQKAPRGSNPHTLLLDDNRLSVHSAPDLAEYEPVPAFEASPSKKTLQSADPEQQPATPRQPDPRVHESTNICHVCALS